MTRDPGQWSETLVPSTAAEAPRDRQVPSDRRSLRTTAHLGAEDKNQTSDFFLRLMQVPWLFCEKLNLNTKFQK